MKHAPIPADDRARLGKLGEYEILDTPPDAEFRRDHAARLAYARNADRADLAGRRGAPVVQVELRPASQGDAARHLLLWSRRVRRCPAGGQRRDRRRSLRRQPACYGAPGGALLRWEPLRSQDGFVLGTLCAIDHRARDLSADQLEALHLLAGQVVALLELWRAGAVQREALRVLAGRESQLADRDRRLQQCSMPWWREWSSRTGRARSSTTTLRLRPPRPVDRGAPGRAIARPAVARRAKRRFAVPR